MFIDSIRHLVNDFGYNIAAHIRVEIISRIELNVTLTGRYDGEMNVMKSSLNLPEVSRSTHPWLYSLGITFIPGHQTPILEDFVSQLLDSFNAHGHNVQEIPNDQTDFILTTAPFGEPIPWRQGVLFTSRRRYGLQKTPAIYTILHATNDRFQRTISHFESALKKDPIERDDFSFPGLDPNAHQVLLEQGLRGGPILSLERVIQAQSKSIKVILVVGDDAVEEAYLFDLVGAHPRIEISDPDGFYDLIALRIATTECTHEVTKHEIESDVISHAVWEAMTTPAGMRTAGQEIGQRGFFTNMIRISDLVQVPAVSDAIASQYSEGCFATWDPHINGLIATITGSARPVDKGNIQDNDLAVIVGVREDGEGAIVKHVENKSNDPPSSEAVEMIDMDYAHQKIQLSAEWDISNPVPVMRSKLHGHRGVSAYHPEYVEYVPLDPPYYHFPVSCATSAQARGIKTAFARAEALVNPHDSRQVVFTVLPGHGVVIAEKWVHGKEPLQLIWEYMDSGRLVIDHLVPQGDMGYALDSSGMMQLTQ